MSDKNITALVEKYQQSISSGKGLYLDADQFCDIIDYYDSLGDLDEAKTIIEMALSIHPDSQPLILKKARLMVFDGYFHEALEYLNIFPGEYDFDLYLIKIECYLQLGLLAEAYELVSVLLKDDEVEIDVKYAELGFLFVEADLHKEAISYLEKSLIYNPDNIEVLGDLSYCYEMISDYDKSIEASNKILDLDPYSFDTWVNLGKLYTLQENYSRALDAFDFALTINESDATLIKLMAHCLSLCNRMDEAIGKFEEYLSLYPSDYSINISISDCYVTLEQFDKAFSYLEKYLIHDTENAEVYAKKSYILFRQDLAQEAKDTINEGLSICGESSELYLMSAEINVHLGNMADAIADLNKVIDYESDLTESILDKIASIYIGMDDYEMAIETLLELLKKNNTYPKAKEKLSLSYFESGSKERFVDYLYNLTITELKKFLSYFYTDPQISAFGEDRTILINRLEELKDSRILFKNIKF